MPNPVALLQVSLAGAPPVTGVVPTTTGTSVQPSGISTVGWQQQKFEIYDYPVGFSCPSGWSTDTVGVYFYAVSASAPPFTPNVWGKYMLRLTVNNGLNGNGQNDPTLVDVTCLLDIPSSVLVFHDIGFGETNQVSRLKQWLGTYQANLRIIDAAIGGGVAVGLASTTPAAVATAGAIGTGLTAARADHAHALPFGPVQSALAAASGPVSLNGQPLISCSSLSTDIAANVAAAGALRLPVGDGAVLALKGATHATVALLSTAGSGTEVVLGDGVEITSVLLRGAGVTATISASGLDLPAPMTLDPVAAPASPGTGWRVYVDSADGRLKAVNSNGVIAILSGHMQTTNSKTFVGNNATVFVPIFGITGNVRIFELYMVVTTVLGANHTGSMFRANDQTMQLALASTSSVALSGAPAGSMAISLGYSGSQAGAVVNTTGGIKQPASTGTTLFSDFIMLQKSGTATNIEYGYATTDAPTSGAAEFFIIWEPLSAGAMVSAI